MTPGNLNLEIYQGITFGPLILTCKDEAGDPVDLEDFEVFADVRQTPPCEISFSFGPEITDAAEGEITILISDEDTNDLPLGAFFWDLVLQNPSGARMGPYLAGSVTVRQPISQPPVP